MEMPGLMSVLARLPLPPDAEKEIQKFLQISTPTARLMKNLQFERACCGHLQVSGPDIGKLVNIKARWNSPPCFPKVLLRPVLWRPKVGYKGVLKFCYVDAEPFGEPSSNIWLNWPSEIYRGSQKRPLWHFSDIDELVDLERDPDECRKELQRFQNALFLGQFGTQTFYH